jgi:ankyrin repeat protein
LLLTHNADPNIRAADGCNALHRAVAHNKLDSVKLLLAAGADPNIVDREEHCTCLDCAIARGFKQCQKLLENRRGQASERVEGVFKEGKQAWTLIGAKNCGKGGAMSDNRTRRCPLAHC